MGSSSVQSLQVLSFPGLTPARTAGQEASEAFTLSAGLPAGHVRPVRDTEAVFRGERRFRRQGRAATARPAAESRFSAPREPQATGRAPHRRPLPAPRGSARNVGDPAAPRSDRPPGQSAGRRREAPPPPRGWFPPGAGRGGGLRRTEGRRHLGGGDVSPALCSGPGSCRRVGRGGGREESGDLAAGRVPGGGTATCGARRPSASVPNFYGSVF